MVDAAQIEFLEQSLFEFGRVVRGEVRHFVPLDVTPDLLDGVELGSIRRQQFDLEARVVGHEFADRFAFVHAASIPDQDHRASKMLQQLANEPGDRGRFEMIVREGAEVETQMSALGRDGQSRDDRDLVAVFGAMLQDGRFALGSQGAADQRAKQRAAFVDEDQMGA